LDGEIWRSGATKADDFAMKTRRLRRAVAGKSFHRRQDIAASPKNARTGRIWRAGCAIRIESWTVRREALGDDLGAVTGASLDKGVELDALASGRLHI